MHALIFGSNGQDGHYLSDLCKHYGLEAIGVSRSGNFINGDISNYDLVQSLVKKYTPVYIFHLAANSTTQHNALFENHDTISTGTLNVLESVKKYSPGTKVFLTGSGVQFKNTGKPISENDEFHANSPYAVARIQSVYAARYYRSLGIRTYVGYLFHHESPLRKSTHVSKIISLLANRISLGSEEVIQLGDIKVEKEWAFAGDIAKGIFTLIEQDEVFEVTIGTGKTYSIEQWLNTCFTIIGKDWRDHVRLRKDFSPEYKLLVSNPETINRLGWSPTIQLRDLAEMMIKDITQEIV